MTLSRWVDAHRGLVVGTVTMVAASSAFAMSLTAVSDASEREDEQVCIASWKESPYRNYGYDHIVAIRNDCERAVRCRVTTNVSPHANTATVASETTARVVTFRGAPRPAFSARVACVAEQ